MHIKRESFTAVHTLTRIIAASCRVPPWEFGAAELASYRLVDANGKAVVDNVTIGEKFTKVDGPDEIYNLLKPNAYGANKGAFDDCYSLHSTKELPDFRLKVEQNHTVSGEIISKNQITYSPSGTPSVRFRARNMAGATIASVSEDLGSPAGDASDPCRNCGA